ncbi:MAG: hypothetical protein O3B75_05520 [Planctomycetota bacterium]|nr:hypothetical protein [Planctomycetota bacterium]
MKFAVIAILLFGIAESAIASAPSGVAFARFYLQSDNNATKKKKTPPVRKTIPSTGSAKAVAPAPAPPKIPSATPAAPAAPAAPIIPSVAPASVTQENTITLDADKLVLESLGIRFRPIAGAILTKPVTGSMPIYTVDDSRDPPRYHLQIQTLVSGLSEPNPQAQVNEYLDSLREKKQKFTVLVNEPWIHPKTDGHILFTQTDLGEGVIAVQGWLILQTGPFDFLVVNTLTSRDDFLAIRTALEESFRTIELDDLQEIASKRANRLRSGNQLIQSMTPEKMKALCGGEPRLFRVWQAGEGGQEIEIGYYQVTVLAGDLGDASGEKTPKTTDNPTGLLVIVQGRTIVDAATGRFADMEARFWSAWDHGSEAWTSRVTERGGKLKEKSLAQTGLRSPRATGNPRQVLTVINGNAQSRTRDEKEWTVPNGIYLSQAELLVLSELLPREEKQAALNFAFYAFDPRSMSMPQRVDSWTRTPDGQWMLITQPGLDESAEITWHDANGRRVRRSEPGGFTTEICLPRQLQQIWMQKGLQMQ